MSGMRLVPAEGAAFPWAEALALLRRVPQLDLDPLDIPALIAAGRAMGWSQTVIDHHWSLHAHGKCFRFEQEGGVELSGSLYEDSVFFSFADDDHAAACRPVVEKFARKLGLVVQQE